jgi:L-ascorbate metabolism protein UlaG (beta-lactamase superfamily)
MMPAMARPAATAIVAAFAVLFGAAAGASAHGGRGLVGGGAVASAAAADDAAMVRTRSRYFGAANVDQRTGAVRRDRVIFSWFGVANFALAIRGHVVLLDAWIPRGAFSGYVPATTDELAALRPELILIGHAHFDHAADATPLAVATGAPLAGTAEHCADLRARASGPALPPRCIELFGRDAPRGSQATPQLLRGVEVTALKHLHSGATRPDRSEPYHVPVIPLPTTTSLEHPPTPSDMIAVVGHLPDAEGGNVLYRFRVGDLSLVWHDTSGPAADYAPGLFDKLRALRSVDVQLGAIQGFNQFTNGMRDPRQYIEALAPRLFVPTHHDDWAPGVTTRAVNYRSYFYDELAKIPAERRPQVRFIADPEDYVRPDALTFPVRLEPVQLVRRCAGRGRLRVRLVGDVADVVAARFRLPGARARRDAVAPFAVTLVRRGAARARVVATVTDVDGNARTLTRSAPRCGRAAPR